MSQETLSAMLDGECSSEEIRTLLDTAEDPAGLTAKWARMCLASELFSGNASIRAPADFCAGVMKNLGRSDDSELSIAASSRASVSMPGILTRQPEVKVAAFARGITVKNVPKRRESLFRRNFARPLVGLAAAASLAFVATIAGRSVLGGHSESQSQMAASLPPAANDKLALNSTTTTQDSGIVKVADRVAAEDPAELGWAQLDAESARELNEYLAQHNNYGTDQGFGGPLGAGRMAVSTADYRPAAGSN